jgi:hypothetical protein
MEAQVEPTVGEDAAAQSAVAERDDYKVFHAMGAAVGVLAQAGNVGVVGQCHGQPQAVAQHGGQGYDTLPGQVGGIDDTAGKEVGTWAAYAYRAYGVETVVGFGQQYDALGQRGDVVVD